MNVLQIDIVIVDDESLFVKGLVALLEPEYIRTLDTAKNGEGALRLLETLKPDIVLLDLEMPLLNGSKALNSIRNRYPKLKVIIVSSYHDEELIKDLLNRGACAFVSKKDSKEILVEAIKVVHNKGIYKKNLPELFQSPAKKDRHYYKLIFTKKELGIISLMCQGKTIKDIAEQLDTSEKTVGGHLTAIYKKVGVKNKGEFLKYSIEAGLQFVSYPRDFNSNFI
ncbi:MAG: response regulator transcription factor [Bacteroidetes bacterium]|nr:response regulator transcription factor [Bacteroidota bacterium]